MLTPFILSLLLAPSPVQSRAVWLEDFDLTLMSQGWHRPQKRLSVEGTPLTIGKVKFEHGVGTHADSEFALDLHRNAMQFTAQVGLDDETMGRGSIRFLVYVDGKKEADSGTVAPGDSARPISVDLQGARNLDLVVQAVGEGNSYDHADWGDAKILIGESGPVPTPAAPYVEPPMAIYMGHSDRPELNGARIVGCSPGKPFLFKIPASGKGPLNYSAKSLPPGLTLDPSSGIISGSLGDPATYEVSIAVSGPAGHDSRILTIVCGDHKLALTPPMGWNSWNVWGTTVTADKVRAAADSFVSEGLIDYGYRSVNIDDAWEGGRDSDGNIQTNEKFGDMGALASYVHSKGVLLGIYSSPGPKTCAGYEASYQHEQQDANSYAKWGIDYLKYDWCSYGGIAPRDPSLADFQAPYIKMRQCLDNCGRDIIFSLCQYGMGDVWNWGKSIGGNLWRTTGDISDNYGSMSGIAFSQSDHASGAGPGGWNDPDMLVVGNLGWGAHPHPTGLTPNEQVTHITMWSLLAAPLILGCDLTHLDRWTKALITNHDVIDIDQDPLGKPAQRMFSTPGGVEVWARPLWDGTWAVGLMNRDRVHQSISVTWSQLGLSGPQPVRNLWLRKSAGTMDRGITMQVPGHGAELFKVGTPRE